MCLRNTKNSFGTITKICHWLSVVLVISMIVIGLMMEGMANSPDKLKLYGLHKSGGITVLAIVSFWFLWRLSSMKPAYPDTLSKLQQLAATAVKYTLMTLLFIMPLTGWGMSSAAGFPVSVYGLFTMPDLLAYDKSLSGDLKELHELFAYILIGIISMHVLAALLHHFYFKDNVLRRMLPFGEKKKDV